MSIYRTSTANSYDVTLQNINRRSAALATQQERLSSGKRVLRASDDAVAATLSERAQNRQARVEADKRALEASRSALTQAESAMGEATDILHNVRELMVQAGNPSLGASERKDLALQLSGLRDQMLGVANRADTSGLTLFGGLGGADQPFVDTYNANGGTVSFKGQAGQYLPTTNSLPHAIDGNAAWMQVPAGNGTFTATLSSSNLGQLRTDLGSYAGATPLPTPLQAGGPGYSIKFTSDTTFQILDNTTPPGTPIPMDGDTSAGPYSYTFTADKTISFANGVNLQLQGAPKSGDQVDIKPADQPTNIFQTINDTIAALNASQTNQAANLTQQVGRGLKEVDAGMDQILAARGRLGEWLKRADSMSTLLEDRSVAYQKENSDLTDLDLVKGISDFQTQQTALDAALKSYSSVQKLSLFQYIA